MRNYQRIRIGNRIFETKWIEEIPYLLDVVNEEWERQEDGRQYIKKDGSDGVFVPYVAAGKGKGKTKLVRKATRIATDKIRDVAKGLRKENEEKEEKEKTKREQELETIRKKMDEYWEKQYENASPSDKRIINR